MLVSSLAYYSKTKMEAKYISVTPINFILDTCRLSKVREIVTPALFKEELFRRLLNTNAYLISPFRSQIVSCFAISAALEKAALQRLALCPWGGPHFLKYP
jgi:hypothetical protein